MKAIWRDTVIAESSDTVIVEGNHYFPRESIASGYFRDSDHQTFCPWKGTANYYTLEIDGNTNENAAWYYPDPKPDASMISDRVAFWRGVQVVE